MQAVDECWKQQQRWWLGYRLGNAKVQTGWEPVSVMSPAWDYHKGRSFPIWEELKSNNSDSFDLKVMPTPVKLEADETPERSSKTKLIEETDSDEARVLLTVDVNFKDTF